MYLNKPKAWTLTRRSVNVTPAGLPIGKPSGLFPYFFQNLICNSLTVIATVFSGSRRH
jgi:hypothetical protein